MAEREPCSIVEMLRRRAEEAPTREAYRFLHGKPEQLQLLTYGGLDQRAMAIGGWLRSRCRPGLPIALIFPPGLEYITAFYGTLYGGGVAVPLNTPTSKNSIVRLEAVIRSAGCRVALTTLDLLTRIDRARAEFPSLATIEFVALEAICSDASLDWRDPCTSPETIVMVQYTSGSTSEPKGVKLLNRNLLHNVSLMFRVSGLDASDIGVSWLPHYHDMGLVAGLLMPAYGGFPVALLSPSGFLSKPIRWLDAISKHRATVSGAPNFGYEECVRSIREEELDGLDLSSWRVAYCGAETVRADTMERFVTAFSRSGFRERTFFPCYGLAEATLMVTGGPAESSPVVRWLSKSDLRNDSVVDAVPESANAISMVASGALIPDNTVLIVDLNGEVVCEQGKIGEIWLSGPSIADGYWGAEEATQEVFGAALADTRQGPFLRTGDLGFVESGMLFVVGRRKDLIIIRGSNYHPQDIEVTVAQSHPSLVPTRYGAVFSINVDGEERLVVVQEIKRHLTQAVHKMIIESIVESVAEQHGLPVYAISLVREGSIARTTSGKVQRQRNRSDFLLDRLAVVAHWRIGREDEARSSRMITLSDGLVGIDHRIELERALASELADLLEIDVGLIGPNVSIFDLGIDSLIATRLQNRIQSKWNAELTQSEIIRGATVSGLSALLLAKQKKKPAGHTDEELGRIVDELEALSEERVAELLHTMGSWGRTMPETEASE